MSLEDKKSEKRKRDMIHVHFVFTPYNMLEQYMRINKATVNGLLKVGVFTPYFLTRVLP